MTRATEMQPIVLPELRIADERTLIAVDIGNNRAKLGRFRVPVAAAATCDNASVSNADGNAVSRAKADRLPEPLSTLSLTAADLAESGEAGGTADETGVPIAGAGARLAAWLAAETTAAWWIGSVNRPLTTRLLDWIRTHRPRDVVVLLTSGDLPLDVRLERPDMVGIDRLLDAVGANALRAVDRPAVVVDIGTAITVDLISAAGAFEGGAILPGLAMAARALHEFTDLLPLIEPGDLTAAPPPLGKATAAAMRSGLFWGAVGAIRELTTQLSANGPQAFVTGGGGAAVAAALGAGTHYLPHLTLGAIALVADAHERGTRSCLVKS